MEKKATLSESNSELTFEQALARLEEVVQLLETSEMDLDKSLALFQEGIGLSRICHQKLEEVERKIEKVLSEGQDIVTKPAAEMEDG